VGDFNRTGGVAAGAAARSVAIHAVADMEI